jgi:hypothetical protein
LPNKSAQPPKVTTEELVRDGNEQGQSSDDVASCSSSTLKRYEEVRKDQGTSPDPTLTGQQSSSRPSLQDGQQPEEVR